MPEDPIERVIRESRAGVDPIRIPDGDFVMGNDGRFVSVNACKHSRWVETARPSKRVEVHGKPSADCQCLDCGEMFLWVD